MLVVLGLSSSFLSCLRSFIVVAGIGDNADGDDCDNDDCDDGATTVSGFAMSVEFVLLGINGTFFMCSKDMLYTIYTISYGESPTIAMQAITNDTPTN